MFINLKTVFDQVKVNAIRVKLVPTAIGGTGYMQNVIAWDRNGEQNITWLKAVSYGSAKTNYFMGGGKTTLTHFIAAETIGEKTQYMPTQDILNAPNMSWKPMLIFGIAAPANAGAQDNWYTNFAIEFAFDCTFRGTRLQ